MHDLRLVMLELFRFKVNIKLFFIKKPILGLELDTKASDKTKTLIIFIK